MIAAALLACGPAPEPVVLAARPVRVEVTDTRAALLAPTRVLAGPRPVRLAGLVHAGDPAYYRAVEAFLAPCATVLHEGLLPDAAAPPPADDDVAVGLEAVGMVFQRDALLADDRFVRADRTVAEVRAELLATPEGAANADAWLVDRDRGALREVLAAASGDGRLRHVVRLAMIRGLAHPGERGAAWADVVIGSRDRAAVAALEALPPGDAPACVVYGADHLADLEARLRARGWRVEAADDLVVIAVDLADAGLGPVQARQLLSPR